MPAPLHPHHALELIDAPATTPISLAEVKTQLRIETSDDDTMLSRLINVAVAYVDVKGVLGAGMITQKWGQWLANNPGTVTLALGPVQSVTAVKYYDEAGVLQTDTLSNYEVFGTSTSTTIAPKSGFSWPSAQSRPDAIRIEYEIGYGDAASDVPDTLRHALLMLVAHWYENREQTTSDRMAEVPFGFNELVGIERGRWYG